MMPSSTPEYKAMLNAFLLGSYLKTLSDLRFSLHERMDAITRLEIELERLAAFNAGTNDQLARAVDHVFAWVGDSVDIAPALDWYLDFLSGRDEEWLKVVSTDRLSRLWKSVSHLPLRAKVLSTLLTLDLVNDPRYPENSVVRKLFIDSNGLGARAELVGDCRIIAQMLLQRAVAASESTTTEMAIRNVRNFSLRVLRLGIQAKFPDDSDLQTAIAESAILELGDLGTRGPEFELLLMA